MIKMKSKSSSILRVAGVAFLTLGLAACNAVHGAGRDVSAIGHDVSRGASATQQSITNTTGASTH